MNFSLIWWWFPCWYCLGDEGQKEQAKWVRGVHMVADVKLMPNGPNVGPNPHHEAEKLIPAILLSHLYGLENSTLHWFTSTDPSTISEWSLGLIKVFQQTLRVNFLNVPNDHEPQVCFEDAILFSGMPLLGSVGNLLSLQAWWSCCSIAFWLRALSLTYD